MATCKRYFDTRNKTAIRFPVKVRISHKGKNAYVKTNLYPSFEEWDFSAERIQSPYKNLGRANSKLNRIHAIVEEVIDDLKPKWNQMTAEKIRDVAEERVAVEFEELAKKRSPEVIAAADKAIRTGLKCFNSFSSDWIDELYMEDRGGSASTIEDTVISLRAFTRKARLPFTDITIQFLKNYEAWYLRQYNKRGKRNNLNGLGFRLRDIRRIYNRAVKDESTGATRDLYPFGIDGYSIKEDETENQTVSHEDIAKLFCLELEEGIPLWNHLNYFKYYFECWGMNYMDLAFLRVYQVQGGRLQYRRRKTRWSRKAKRFNIEHSPMAQSIINYYTRGKEPTDLVFPIMDDIAHLNEPLDTNGKSEKEAEEIKQQELANRKLFQKKLENRRSNHIRRLKTLSRKAGCCDLASIYKVRHTYFDIALNYGVSKSKISEMLGHSNYQVTENYLEGFSGNQLTESAKVVSGVISQFNGESLLEDVIMVMATGEKMMVGAFLSHEFESLDESRRTPKTLVIQLLLNTDCASAMRAEEYTMEFLQKIKALKVA